MTFLVDGTALVVHTSDNHGPLSPSLCFFCVFFFLSTFTLAASFGGRSPVERQTSDGSFCPSQKDLVIPPGSAPPIVSNITFSLLSVWLVVCTLFFSVARPAKGPC